jgi:dethiobiotin synthetase
MSTHLRRIFISGIGTDVGKTLVSAIFVKALEADYWKPIQCGNLEGSDRGEVARLAASRRSEFFPEAFALPDAVSPHLAAARAGLEIALSKLLLPESGNTLIIEGAGGVLVPLNDDEMLIDLAVKCACPVVVVATSYVGSINHTLLSVEALQARKVPILGLVFNGARAAEPEEFILRKTKLPLLLTVNREEKLDSFVLEPYCSQLRRRLNELGFAPLG